MGMLCLGYNQANDVFSEPHSPVSDSSSLLKMDCDHLLDHLNADSMAPIHTSLSVQELLHWHQCALSLGKNRNAERAFLLLKEKPYLRPKSWIAVVDHFSQFKYKLQELQAIEEARSYYPQNSKIMNLEINYHIRNQTVDDYKLKIRSKIKAGDPRFYFVMARLNTEIGKKETDIHYKSFYYDRAILNLEQLLSFNPSSMGGKQLLYDLHDSMSSLLLGQIIKSEDDRKLDSLTTIEDQFFREQMKIIEESKANNNPPIDLVDLFAQVHGWKGDTVSFEIINNSPRSTQIISKSTPHCELIGNVTIGANQVEQYKLKVLPSASQSEFELTPTLFFSGFDGSISLVVSGFIAEIPPDNTHLLTKNAGTQFNLTVQDKSTGQVVYHAQSLLTNKNGDSLKLNYGSTIVKSQYGKITMSVEADGYIKKIQQINFNKTGQRIVVLLDEIQEKEMELDTLPLNPSADMDQELPGLESIVTHFKNSSTPSQHIIVMVDVSQSMRRAGYLNDVSNGMRKLIQNLRPQDSITILTFSTTKTVIADHVGANLVDSLNRALNNIKAQGGTNAKVALKSGYAVANRYHTPHAKSVLVMITDGKLNAPGTTSSWYESYLVKYYRPRDFRLNIMLYSNEPSDFTSLTRLSNVTGGTTQPGIGRDLSELIIRYCLQP